VDEAQWGVEHCATAMLKYNHDMNCDHCFYCHYAVTCYEVSNSEGSSSWDKTADVLWAAFCLQWPLIGWGMIMGKE
jgi:hypothetical protein